MSNENDLFVLKMSMADMKGATWGLLLLVIATFCLCVGAIMLLDSRIDKLEQEHDIPAEVLDE